MLPDYKLIGAPARYTNGHGRKAASYLQRYRLLSDPPRKVRSVSLATSDLTVARRRAVRFVEDRMRADLMALDPKVRTATKGIVAALKEYLDDLAATGNSPKQVKSVKMKIERIIKCSKLKEYAQLDGVTTTKAIAKLAKKHTFGVVTCNRYREAARAWAAWMKKNHRWPTHVLADMAKFKGDDTPTRRRTILNEREFEALLAATLVADDRRNLSGEQRHYLYLTASQTGLRAQELHSLKPSSFDFKSEPATVTIACTVSKRRKTDVIILSREFAQLMKTWLADLDPERQIWGCSASWHYKAASMLRADLAAAKIKHERDGAVVDFHSFRCYRVTKAIMSGRSSRVVMQSVRLSSEALLDRYTKIPQAAITDLVEAVPMPKLPLRIVG